MLDDDSLNRNEHVQQITIVVHAMIHQPDQKGVSPGSRDLLSLAVVAFPAPKHTSPGFRGCKVTTRWFEAFQHAN